MAAIGAARNDHGGLSSAGAISHSPPDAFTPPPEGFPRLQTRRHTTRAPCHGFRKQSLDHHSLDSAERNRWDRQRPVGRPVRDGKWQVPAVAVVQPAELTGRIQPQTVAQARAAEDG